MKASKPAKMSADELLAALPEDVATELKRQAELLAQNIVAIIVASTQASYAEEHAKAESSRQ